MRGRTKERIRKERAKNERGKGGGWNEKKNPENNTRGRLRGR
jgi:hypothetical protein